jgi:hypothetical protein
MKSARNIGVEANVEAHVHTGFCSIAHMGVQRWAKLPVLVPFAVWVGRRSTSGVPSCAFAPLSSSAS